MSRISDIIKTKIERLAAKSKKKRARTEASERHIHKENMRSWNRAERETEEARLHEDGHLGRYDPVREYTKEELNKMDIEARRLASHRQKIKDKRSKNIPFDEDIPF